MSLARDYNLYDIKEHNIPTNEEHADFLNKRWFCGAISWDYCPNLDREFKKFRKQFESQRNISDLSTKFNKPILNIGTNRTKIIWKPTLILKLVLNANGILENIMEYFLYRYVGNELHKYLCPIKEGTLEILASQFVKQDCIVPIDFRLQVFQEFKQFGVLLPNCLNQSYWGWLGNTPVLLNYGNWTIVGAEQTVSTIQQVILTEIKANANITSLESILHYCGEIFNLRR